MAYVIISYRKTPPPEYQQAVIQMVNKYFGTSTDCVRFEGPQLVSNNQIGTRQYGSLVVLLEGMENAFKAAFPPPAPYTLTYAERSLPNTNLNSVLRRHGVERVEELPIGAFKIKRVVDKFSTMEAASQIRRTLDEDNTVHLR